MPLTLNQPPAVTKLLSVVNTVIVPCTLNVHYCFTEFTIIYTICDTNNCKVNFTLEQATKAQRPSRGIALLFL